MTDLFTRNGKLHTAVTGFRSREKWDGTPNLIASLISRIFPIIAMMAWTSGAMGSELIRNLEAGKPQTVVFYGTSVSTGGWTNEVAGQLKDKYGKLVTPAFSGMPGKQSRDGVAQLQERVLKHSPDTVFIEFAINDAVLRFEITPQESRENLLKIIGMLRERNPKVEIILSTMNDVFDSPRWAAKTSRPQLADYYQVYREVAAEQHCLLIDHFSRWNALREADEAKFKGYLPDGLHPNAEAAKDFITPAVMAALAGEVAEKPSAVLKQITTRTAAAQRSEKKTPGHDACTTRIQHTVTADATIIRLVYAAPARTGYELKAAVDIGGVTHPLTFDGQSTVIVEGAGHVVSDPIAVTLKAGDIIHSRTYAVHTHDTNAGTWQRVMPLSAERDEWHGEGDLTAATAQPQTPTYKDNTRGPLHILGNVAPDAKAVGFSGDSIVSLVESPWTIRLADKAHIAWSHATTGGDSILYQDQRRVVCWPLGLSGFTHYISAFGANDIGRSDSTLEKYVEHWTWAKHQGVKVYQATILPIASSTDRFTTLEGQTPRDTNATRIKWNDWLRDGAPLIDGKPAFGTTDPGAVRAGQPGHPLDGIIEIADAVESSRNSGKWRVDHGPIGGDGLHPSPKAHEFIADAIPADLFD